MHFLLHCPWSFEQHFKTFQGSDWPPTLIDASNSPKEKFSSKAATPIHSQSE
ncbi:hypothetical protein BDA96_07G097200 [Sorghum bicolor]|uniref:Uncharacterized protein n=2 Tax=Sorghum bicolor TaxID=4558 RepID=A0A921QJP0_SORBI|nr:hypothetical protein BDA96_07G097200 [Sorghum bicolor]KXG24824.1 hypothetical protein SORBI_3007G090800 [Sorghum bicolor]